MDTDISNVWKCKQNVCETKPPTTDGEEINVTNEIENTLKYNSYCNFDDDNDDELLFE